MSAASNWRRRGSSGAAGEGCWEIRSVVIGIQQWPNKCRKGKPECYTQRRAPCDKLCATHRAGQASHGTNVESGRHASHRHGHDACPRTHFPHHPDGAPEAAVGVLWRPANGLEPGHCCHTGGRHHGALDPRPAPTFAGQGLYPGHLATVDGALGDSGGLFRTWRGPVCGPVRAGTHCQRRHADTAPGAV